MPPLDSDVNGKQLQQQRTKNDVVRGIPDSNIPSVVPIDPTISTLENTKAMDNATSNSPEQKERWRLVVARGMDSISNAINDNIVAARYGTIAAIALLSAYGISKTPLFFRYNTVSDIPASQFVTRRTIHGRLVRVLENDAIPATAGDGEVEKPIVCMVRHLSPSGRLLNRSTFDFFMRSSPSAAVGKRLEDNSDELLKVEIAGIRAPPFYLAPSHLEQPGDWLQRLAEQRAPVACQLLARRVTKADTSSSTRTRRDATTRYPELRDAKLNADEHLSEQTAICRLSYRAGLQLFRTDVATSLVRYGRSSVLSGLYIHESDRPVVDNSSRLEDLRNDAKYMEKLGRAEVEAVKESMGMWADPQVRENRKDIVEEATFQTTAGVLQRLWRWLRGG